jgi:hypothetical protein
MCHCENYKKQNHGTSFGGKIQGHGKIMGFFLIEQKHDKTLRNKKVMVLQNIVRLTYQDSHKISPL